MDILGLELLRDALRQGAQRELARRRDRAVRRAASRARRAREREESAFAVLVEAGVRVADATSDHLCKVE